jgi:hypothetical protein
VAKPWVFGGLKTSQRHPHHRISEDRKGLNQLRYNLREIKAHGPIERDGSRYAYTLSAFVGCKEKAPLSDSASKFFISSKHVIP